MAGARHLGLDRRRHGRVDPAPAGSRGIAAITTTAIEHASSSPPPRAPAIPTRLRAPTGRGSPPAACSRWACRAGSCPARRRWWSCSARSPLHRAAFGLALVVAFSLGLALTLTTIGAAGRLRRAPHAACAGPRRPRRPLDPGVQRCGDYGTRHRSDHQGARHLPRRGGRVARRPRHPRPRPPLPGSQCSPRRPSRSSAGPPRGSRPPKGRSHDHRHRHRAAGARPVAVAAVGGLPLGRRAAARGRLGAVPLLRALGTARWPGWARSPTRSAYATRSTPTTSPRSTTPRASCSQDGQRPMGVGFFFSLGHSTIVFSLAGRPGYRGGDGRLPDPRVPGLRRHHRRDRLRDVPVGDRHHQPDRAGRHRADLPAHAPRRRTTREQLERRLHDRGLMNRLYLGRLAARIDAQLEDVPAGHAVRPGVRHRHRGRAARPVGRSGNGTPSRSGAVLSLPILFAAGMWLHGHHRRRVHEPGVRLGVLEPDPQDLLQHHRHQPVGGGRAGHRHGRAAAGAVGEARAERRRLGLAERARLRAARLRRGRRFVATWVVSVAVWKLHRIEERWSRHLDLDHRKDTIR